MTTLVAIGRAPSGSGAHPAPDDAYEPPVRLGMIETDLSLRLGQRNRPPGGRADDRVRAKGKRGVGGGRDRKVAPIRSRAHRGRGSKAAVHGRAHGLVLLVASWAALRCVPAARHLRWGWLAAHPQRRRRCYLDGVALLAWTVIVDRPAVARPLAVLLPPWTGAGPLPLPLPLPLPNE